MSLRVLIFLLSPPLAAATVALTACTSDGPPACIALAACCASPTIDNPSSCNETATSGGLTDAGCGAQLAMYQAAGQCVPDAAMSTGPVDSGVVTHD